MSLPQADDNADPVKPPPAAPILPDETGHAPGFPAVRVRRLFARRPVLGDPQHANGGMQPPAAPLDADPQP